VLDSTKTPTCAPRFSRASASSASAFFGVIPASFFASSTTRDPAEPALAVEADDHVADLAPRPGGAVLPVNSTS
jgi:hypothetical protein